MLVGDLNDAVLEYMKAQVVVLNERIKMRLSQYEAKHGDGDVKFSDMHIDEPVFQMNADSFNAVLSYSGWATWIEEYGSGSLMDTYSPYYSGYDMNPDRKLKGNAFLGRTAGDIVYRPDGTFYISSGKTKGLNLERPLGKLSPYVPQKAQHLIYTEITFWLIEIIPELRQLVRNQIIAKITNRGRA